MDHSTALEEAMTRAKQLPDQPNDVLLKLYGLYKQATQGDAGDDRPGVFDMVGRAKHDAWAKNRGMSQEAAVEAYAELVDKLAEAS